MAFLNMDWRYAFNRHASHWLDKPSDTVLLASRVLAIGLFTLQIVFYRVSLFYFSLIPFKLANSTETLFMLRLLLSGCKPDWKPLNVVV